MAVTRLREALDRAKTADYPVSVAAPSARDVALADSLEPWHLETTAAAPVQAPEAVPASEADSPRKADADAPPEVTERLSAGEKLIVLPDADVTLVEQFRRLAAALHHAQLKNGTRTVMVASAVEGEGKTLTSTNLALTLSESYQRRVLLIDADLRRPSIHQRFNLDNRVGLSDTLKHVVVDGEMPIHRVSKNLWVITGGPPDPDPMSGLVSDTMRQLLAEASEQFDYVVIDTPPVVLLPDANLLAAMIDAALLVVRANSTPYPLSARAVEAIGRDRILGVVLNRTAQSPLSEGGYYYSHYRYSYGRHEPKRAGLLARLMSRRKTRH
jgi:protein-tyrosine kinase